MLTYRLFIMNIIGAAFNTQYSNVSLNYNIHNDHTIVYLKATYDNYL